MSHSTLLSTKDLAELRRLCEPSFFTEIGPAIDMNRIKNCSRTVGAKREVRVVIRFPSEAGARKWNGMHEKQIRYAGHIGTATIAVLAGTLLSPASGIAAGTAAGIVKDELQARVWYPKVSRGWTLLREYDLYYQQFPKARFYTDLRDTLIDHAGTEVERRFHGRTEIPVGGESGAPEGLVAEIFNAARRERTVIYE